MFRIKPILCYGTCVLITLIACGDKKTTEKRAPAIVFRKLIQTDTSLCEVRESRIATFIEKYNVKDSLRTRLSAFYEQRGYKSAWTNSKGVNEYAGNFFNLLENENGPAKKQQHNENLRSLYASMLSRDDLDCGDTLLQDLEVLLTINFFEYAKRSWGGMSDDLSKRAGWFIVRKQMDYEKLLEDFLTEKQVNAREPVYRQYSFLKEYAQKYNKLYEELTWPDFYGKLTAIKKGDENQQIANLKKLLVATGDLQESDSSLVFDETLSEAVRSFQSRHGLKTNGELDEQTLAELQVPLQQRIQQILINMERCRWVPSKVEGTHVVVNIPQFKMHVYENDDLLWSADVIVGKSNAVNKTVIFNDSLELIVFSPHWNIPQNIITREVLPAVKKNKKYIEKNSLEIMDAKGRIIDPKDVDWQKYEKRFPYVLREKPGPANSLGKVKFLFPNAYDIYIHDTPAKSLFTKTTRDFSHGCIRLSEPEKFARFLLQDDPQWDSLRISEAMNSGQEKFVRLKKKIPVFIAYFTAWVDRDGRLNFARDIYGHDEKMRSLLFVNSDEEPLN